MIQKHKNELLSEVVFCQNVNQLNFDYSQGKREYFLSDKAGVSNVKLDGYEFIQLEFDV